MDDFYEQTAAPKSRGLGIFLWVIGWAAIIVFGFMAVLSLFSIIGATEDGGFSIRFMMLIPTAVFGGIAFLAWRRVDYCRVEFDYTFTNGILDVGQVLNARRRRYLTQLDLHEVTKCGPVNSQGFKKIVGDNTQKKHNWFCNRDAKLYYFVFTKKGQKHLAIMELNEKMVALVRSKSYLNPGVWTDDSGRQITGV